MPRYAVVLHVNGPFVEKGSSLVHDGAYTHRFVIASDPDSARSKAIAKLRRATSFRTFRLLASPLAPSIAVTEIRIARWTEGLKPARGYTFYAERYSTEVRR